MLHINNYYGYHYIICYDIDYTWKWQPGSDPGVDVHRAQTELHEDSLVSGGVTTPKAVMVNGMSCLL